MNKLLSFLGASLLVLTGCGSTSKKLMDLPPLAVDAPVQVLYAEPNVKYDRVCEIEAKGNNSFSTLYTQKEDFESMFKSEARKCGANAVIFGSMYAFAKGEAKATGTGIRITGQAAGLVSEDQVKAFSLAIQTHDLKKVQEILKDVPKAKKDRAPSDDQLVNLGLYIATLDGMKCDAKIVDLLEKEYGALVPKFQPITLPTISKNDSDTPLCKDVMARSLSKMENISDAVLAVNNHYVYVLNSYDKSELNKTAAKYSTLIKEASRLIAEACAQSNTNAACAMKTAFVDFANKSKSSPSAAVKKNAQDVLKILSK